MLNKIFGLFASLVLFYIFNSIFKASSAYLPKMRIKKYIIIRNKTIAKILIDRQVGRNKFVQPCDSDKMSIVGLMSYIFVAPFNLLNLILNIMVIFGYDGIKNISDLSETVYCILGLLIGLNLLIFLINVLRFDDYFS